MSSDLIYREDAKDYARHALAKGADVLEYLNEVPAASICKPKHGKWETVMLEHEYMGCRPKAHYCSECNYITWFRTFFCPNCGADMRGVNNER